MKSIQYLLHDAVCALDVERIELLLNQGANPNVNPYKISGGYVFDLIEQYGLEYTLKGEEVYRVLEVLLEGGAEPNVEDAGGHVLDRFEHREKFRRVCLLLRRFGADST